MQFKRDNELVESVVKIADRLLPNEEQMKIYELIKAYERVTYKEWTDRNNFNFDAIDSMINDFGFDEKEIAQKLANNHNTLQQSFMRLCMRFIERMAEKTYWDGRNEASVQTAKKIVEALGGNTYLPMI